MKRIGLLSDTHHYLDDAILRHLDPCDEIWHAGDFGTDELAETLRKHKPLKGVYGNIDGPDIRSSYPETVVWECEKVRVLMMHIGGYPPRYNSVSKKLIGEHRPRLFISGHSHILKIMFDEQLQCLHINPGAAGKQGWHTMRTMVRFTIDGTAVRDCEIVELGKRG